MRKQARICLQFKPGTDVALLNAMMHVIVEEGLHDDQFVQARTDGFEKLREHLKDLRAGEDGRSLRHRCGDHPYCRAHLCDFECSMVFWGMGISQHTHGTDNARCLIDLALITGQVGRPGTGLHPLRGQNNVQGASDAGLIPMVLAGLSAVEMPRSAGISKSSGIDGARPDNGLTVVEIMDAVHEAYHSGHVYDG